MIQMGVRWYDPYLSRWISPDTIIPDPANPQSLNRFSYVLGNPLKYVDPSGHQYEHLGDVGYEVDWQSWEAEFAAAHGGQTPGKQDRWDYLFSLHISDFAGWGATYGLRKYLYSAGITFMSDPGHRWTMSDVRTVFFGVMALASAINRELNNGRRATENFRTTVGPAVFRQGRQDDPDYLWYVNQGRHPAALTGGNRISYYASVGRVSVVHELAHVWDNRVGKAFSRNINSFVAGEFAPTEYGHTRGPGERWAETVAGWAYPNYVARTDARAGGNQQWQMRRRHRRYVSLAVVSPACVSPGVHSSAAWSHTACASVP